MWFRSLMAALSNRKSIWASRTIDRNAARRPTPARRLRLESLEERRLLCGVAAAGDVPLAASSHATLGPAAAFVALQPAATTFAPHGGQGHPPALASSSLPSLTVNDVSLMEGQSGQTAFHFTVSLSAPSVNVVSVNFATGNGLATTSTGDFAANSGTVKFQPGERTKTITVFVNGDTDAEVDETFFVNLSRARDASIADAQGIGTILNDDAASGGSGGVCNTSVPCDPLPPPPDEGA